MKKGKMCENCTKKDCQIICYVGEVVFCPDYTRKVAP